MNQNKSAPSGTHPGNVSRRSGKSDVGDKAPLGRADPRDNLAGHRPVKTMPNNSGGHR